MTATKDQRKAAGYMQSLKAIRPFEAQCRSLHAAFLRTLLVLNDVDCAIDVGANRGQSRDFLRNEVSYAGTIESFEPNPSAYEHMMQRGDEDPLWRKHHVALGMRAGSAKLVIRQNERMSSFKRPRNENGPTAAAGLVDVEIQTLDVAVAATTGRRFFLKLDTQGFDIEVLRGASDATLAKTLVLQVELSFGHGLYHDVPSYREFLEYIESRGYCLAAAINLISDEHYRAIEMDGIFVRR